MRHVRGDRSGRSCAPWLAEAGHRDILQRACRRAGADSTFSRHVQPSSRHTHGFQRTTMISMRCVRAAVVVAGLALEGALASAQSAAVPAPSAGPIRLSQIGFLPGAPKSAVVVAAGASAFAIVSAERGDTVLRGSLSAPRSWALSGEENVR